MLFTDSPSALDWARWLCARRAARRLVPLTLALAALTAGLARTGTAHAQRRGGNTAPRVCVPGAQVACACPGGASGAQRCNARGTALEPCECVAVASPPPVTPAAAPTPVPAPPAVAFVAVTPSAPPAAPPSGPPQYTWYGWQILLPDLVGLTLTSTGALVPGGAGLGTYVTGALLNSLGGPIVHWTHGHVGRGFASLFGLRFGLPLAGGLVGAMAGARGGANGTTLGVYLGAGAGWLVGMIIDIAALPYDLRPRSATGAGARWQLAPSLALDPVRNEYAVGLRGSWL